MKVAVVGLGGLGHMAVKIAQALGAEVTVLTQSLKQEDGLRLGAAHYHATSDRFRCPDRRARCPDLAPDRPPTLSSAGLVC